MLKQTSGMFSAGRDAVLIALLALVSACATQQPIAPDTSPTPATVTTSPVDPAATPAPEPATVDSANPAAAPSPPAASPSTGPAAGSALNILSEDALYKILVAEFAGRRGDLDLAVANYLDVTRETRHPEIAKRATTVAVFARATDAALEAARIWVDAAPADIEARQLIVAMYVRAGNVGEALANLEIMLANDPENVGRNLRMVANFLSREQEKETALEVMGQLVARRPGDADALLAYAMLAIRANRLEQARAAIDKVVASTDVNSTIALSYLAVLQQQGEEATAVEWLEQVLAKSKDDFDLRLIYARLLADLKRYDDARKQFTILLKAQPDNADVLYTLGLLSLQSSRVDEAESYLNRLTERPDGTADQARYYLGQIAESRNQTDQALAHYRSLRASAEGSDNYFDAQLRIAFLLSKSDRLNDARAQLHGVRPRHEQDAVQLILAEGEILAEHGGNDDAMAVYDTALDGGYNRDLLYARAMLAAKVDRLDILEGDLRNIIDREPDAVEALNALGYTLADRTDRLQEAYDLVARALQIDNSKFHILDSMGWVLYRMGRLQEAIDYLKKARTLRDDPEVAAHLGEVLWVTGDRDAARDVFDSALKSTPGDQKLLEVIERLRK